MRDNRASQRPLKPTTMSGCPLGERNTACKLTAPSANKKVIEIHAPRCSSHAGGAHSVANAATIAATTVTIIPWPAENNTPAQRETRGLNSELKRVSPSIVAMWSGSMPCCKPSMNTTMINPNPSCGKTLIQLLSDYKFKKVSLITANRMRHLLFNKQLVPHLVPLL